jgi:hypothetical protein
MEQTENGPSQSHTIGRILAWQNGGNQLPSRPPAHTLGIQRASLLCPYRLNAALYIQKFFG